MTSSRRAAPSPTARPFAFLPFNVPGLMGVLNATPDSFYPESRTAALKDAVAAGMRMAEQGASYIDVGGQSTRPGSDAVSLETELDRVVPVIRELAKKLPKKVVLSVDTDKAEVARRALDNGAAIVNDVSALRGDPKMAAVASKAERVILMHRLGDSSKTMQKAPSYKDVVSEVEAFFKERLAAFMAAGGRREQVLLDPGIGFGKELEHNLSLIKHAGDYASIAPVVLGVSRKSMFARLHADSGPQDRLAGSLAVAAWSCFASVSILRVHDVLETRKHIETLKAVWQAA
jgi:dihydropteroate synthase